MLRSKNSIHTQILIRFVLITLLTAAAVTTGAVVSASLSGRQQAIDRIESVATSKQSQVTAWTRALKEELTIASQTEGAFERISVVLVLASNDRHYLFYNKAVRGRFLAFTTQSGLFEELFLLDSKGKVILSTNRLDEDLDYSDQAIFRETLLRPSMRLLITPTKEGSSDQQDMARTAVALQPVFDSDGTVLGFLGGRASIVPLNDILQEATGLGKRGRANLFDMNRTPILSSYPSVTSQDHEPVPPKTIQSNGIEELLNGLMTTSGIYRDYSGRLVVGAYRTLPELDAILAVEQDLSEAFSLIRTTVVINVLIGLVALLLAVMASLAVTRTIANPLTELAKTAQRISAGNLDHVARVDRDDEIGVLAQAFNEMTSRLRESITNLEKSVSDRTTALQEANRALSRRAIQLETSARVSREISAILALDTLMSQIVRVIDGAFGYYSTHIYLVEAKTDELVLRAASKGRNPRFRRLCIGQRSLNTRAIQTGQVQIVNDTASDNDFLFDANLPDTKSELVAPLRMGDQIIGTLDVHSAHQDTFNADDALVIQGLADQIAVAIENARLYDRSRKLAIMEERTRLARELHDSVTQSLYSIVLLSEGWRRLARTNGSRHVDDQLGRIKEIAQQALAEMRLIIHELRPPTLEQIGLLRALHQRLDSVERRVGVEARVIASDLAQLPEPLEEGLYRITLEALNNSLKHAAGTSILVSLSFKQGLVVLEIIDNGRGFDPQATSCHGGMGLISMRERARQLGGSVTICTALGQGTTVRTTIPYQDR